MGQIYAVYEERGRNKELHKLFDFNFNLNTPQPGDVIDAGEEYGRVTIGYRLWTVQGHLVLVTKPTGLVLA